MEGKLVFFSTRSYKKTHMKFESNTFSTIPEWDKIAFIVHGFGNRYWGRPDFAAHPELKDFCPVFLRQIHSDILHLVDDLPDETLTGDALITDRQGILLVVKTADCLPILIVDRDNRAVAALHCGWKSTSQELALKVVNGMKERFRSDPSSLLVAFGPCIGKDCYEVGEDVRQEFEDKGLSQKAFLPHPIKAGKLFLDLRLANKNQLRGGGVKDSNISVVDRCTHCEADLLSHRRSPQSKGRMLSFIGIVPS